MGGLITLFILWYLGKKFIGWINRYTIRVLLMAVFVFVPFLILLFGLNVEGHENWQRVLMFAVLWLPLRWDNQMSPERREYSWAEKNVIHS